MRSFNEDEVEALIKAAISETILGTLDWLRKETDIVNIETKSIIDDCEVGMRKDTKPLTDYIHPRLTKYGITVIKPTTK